MPPTKGPSRKSAPRFALPPAELVVVARNSVAPILRRDVAASIAAESHLNELLPAAVSVSRVFGPAGRLQNALQGTSTEQSGTELLNTFTVFGTSAELAELAESLTADDSVEYAYVKPPAEPPIAPPTALAFDVAAPSADEPPAATPDFRGQQGYLDTATAGIDARWAWTRPGGRGGGIRIIDIEGAWRFTHEDLLQNQGGVIGGTPSSDIVWRNHGTAVIGEIGGDDTSFGITGIAPDSNVRAISIFGGSGSSAAIRQAADALGAGDVILIELHRPGPRNAFAQRDDQDGYIAVEWWPDDFAAIQYAIGRGVIVVEAAGNGGQDFDDPLYETRPANFPTSWRNPLRATGPDSGAIIVGAGAPPPGTNGQDHGPARSRLGFSNFGARVDVQGWGSEVVTTGYGDLQGGTNEDLWYTRQFGGTSSASPIVTGAVASYQGMLAASTGRRTPAQIRTRLRDTGSPQQDAPGRPVSQRIGNLPDLRSLMGVAPKTLLDDIKLNKETKAEIKELKIEKNEKELKIEKNENKEVKIEFKENKNEKVEIKEIKLEKNEKELKIEKVEIRDIEQKFPDIIDPVEQLQRRGGLLGGGVLQRSGIQGAVPGSAAADDTGARLAALEAAVGQLSHFIAQSLRPDLRDGALGHDDSGDDWQTS